MKRGTMQTPQANLPYQAYRPKRHSRNTSGNSQQQSQHLTPNVSPPPTSRPPTISNGLVNGHGHVLSEPVVPLQRDFALSVNGKESHAESEKDGQHLPPNGFAGNGVKITVLKERRRSVSMADVISYHGIKPSSPPPAPSPTPLPALKIVPSLVSSMPPSPLSNKPFPVQNNSAASSTPVSSPSSLLPVSPIIDASSPTELIKPVPVVAATQAQATNCAVSPAGPSNAPALPSVQSSPRPARRTSTFRHIPLRPASTRTPLPSSPLRPASTLTHQRTSSGLSANSRQLDAPSPRIEAQGLRTPDIHALRMSDPPSRVSSLMSTPVFTASAINSAEKDLPSVPALELDRRLEAQPQPRSIPAQADGHTEASIVHNPSRGATLAGPPSSTPTPLPQLQTNIHPSRASTTPSFTPPPVLSPSPSSSSSRTVTRTPAPYRPGFQPKGVYRPRTDEFIEARRTRRDDGRVERTRLERRLEKLISLHFPHPDTQKDKERDDKGKEAADATSRPAPQNRRASSFFDMSSIRGKSAGDLWKGVLQAQSGGKADIRAAEQAITPWEDDSAVSQCPLCQASFHPITNRKHHCRLCGRIICSLPVKHPQRPQTCSLLFVADPLTGEIEEVSEGVDYGVRKRTNSTVQASGKGKGRDDLMGLNDDEKFLKGVRICRDCRPVLLRRQYTQEVYRTPLFNRLYDAFVALEKEIEEALPQFQELILSISHDERPSPEASAARKRLLDAFAQYDALAKRIRKLPCPGGPGSSHDRVQQAIITRANVFLQKHLFPLQSLPKPKRASETSTSSPSTPDVTSPLVDPDSELAKVLQPLLEQEALLESFVEEAKVHRKFEDAQTLKANLAEIRSEIDRILANSDGHLAETRTVKAKDTRGRR